MDPRTRGLVALGLGTLLLVSTLGVSAAVAPDRGVDATDDEVRETVIGVQGGGPGWHKYGEVVMLEENQVAWTETTADSYFDVERLGEDRYVAAFMSDGAEDCGPYESPCSRTGYRVLDVSSGEPEIVEEWSFPVRSGKNSEVHKAEPLPDGGFVVTDMDAERIVVVEDGEEVWEWRASNFYEAPDDPTQVDWLHINDVDYIGDDRFLVSVRNANQLVVVERGEGVVEVINEDDDGSDESCIKGSQLDDQDGDDDVRCGDPAVLNHQHNPQWLGDGAVLVADSDNHRVVELHRTDDGDWEVAWKLRTAGDIDLTWPRDADRLPNGNTLVTDTLNKRVVEVDENGTVVWSTRTEHIPYEADRLPHGEPVGAELYNPPEGPNPLGDDDHVPVLTDALVLLRAGFPWLPFWYAELQVGLTLVSLALAGYGGWTLRRS